MIYNSGVVVVGNYIVVFISRIIWFITLCICTHTHILYTAHSTELDHRQSSQTPRHDQWGRIFGPVQALPTESCVEHCFRDQTKSYSIVIKINYKIGYFLAWSSAYPIQEGLAITMNKNITLMIISSRG